MHHSHGGSHGFWETFISLKFFRSKRGDEQYSYRHDRRRFGSGSGYEEHVDMRESTYDAFVRTPKETRSVPRRDKRERTKDKEHHHQINGVNGIVPRRMTGIDTPGNRDQGQETVVQIRGGGTYLRGQNDRRSPDHTEVLTCAGTGELLYLDIFHHRLHLQNGIVIIAGIGHPPLHRPPPLYQLDSLRQLSLLHRQLGEGRTIYMNKELERKSIMRGEMAHSIPGEEPNPQNTNTEPKNLDEEIVIIEESDVDNHRNRSIPRGDPPQMEPLVYNVAIDPVGAEPLDLDEKPNEAFSQLRGGFRERHDNTSDSQDTPVASSKLPEPPPVAIEYTVGGPSAWEQLPESSKQILAHYVIPKSSSFVHWDGKSRPFNVWSSVFDASSLGDWIYGWAAQHYRPVPAPRHRTRSRAAWRGHREEERENAERARKLRAVYRFCETLAQLGRNVAEAEASMQTKSHDRPRMQRTPSMQRRYKKGKRRLGDGKEKLDDIEALVQVCQEAMVNEEIKEKYENIGGEEGRIPKLGESTMGAFIDALVGTEGFWEIEEAARAWNRWFRRWWRHESVMGGYYYDDNDEDEDYDILRGGPQV
ncbi:hypothetical protein F4810DRAFT_713582 [Camillea tinctor]|nr:hypothetical protein F4810DRAFT_713582 [Camillea tinctor]